MAAIQGQICKSASNGQHTLPVQLVNFRKRNFAGFDPAARKFFAGGVETPFGGYKQSGIGREKGVEALEHYRQTKCVTIRL